MTQVATSDAQQGQYVRANGLNVYYEEEGSGEPLVLVYGGSALWAPYISAFAQHFRVIVPDSRGYGRTDKPSEEFSYRLMADDLAAFIGCLGLHKPLICGYSDGGQIALELGMRYPELARAFIVGAPWWKFSDAYVGWCRQIGMEAPGVVNLEQLEKVLPHLVGMFRQFESPDPDYWKTLATQLSVMWLTPLNYTAEDFERIVVPTLILVGDRDDLIPVEEVVEMYRLIPNAELAVAPGSSHVGVLFEKVGLFTTLVLDFLLRHSAQAAQ